MICIIPARSGSRRIPNKNIKEFQGKPIIAYSIEAAQKSRLFTNVYVSTDSADIANVATDYRAIYHWRNSDLARDEVGTQEVIRATLEDLLQQYDTDPWVCCLYATAPMVTANDLQCAFRLLLSTGAHYVVGKGYPRADITPTSEGDEGAFYFGYTHAFLTEVPLDDASRVYQPLFHVDINTTEDWNRAEKLWEERYGAA